MGNNVSRDTVSVVMPTLDVEDWIRPTLDALRFCDEVVIVDSYSTDRTREICEGYPNVRFLLHTAPYDVNFNYGMERATGKWIIRCDSDEVISPKLRESIIEVLSGNPQGYDCYEAFMHLFFFGYRIRGGYGNQWRDMLFKRGTAWLPLQSEHDGFQKSGPCGRLAGHYDHFTNRSISIWVDKVNRSTDRDVARDPTSEPASVGRMIYDMVRMFQRMYTVPGRLWRDGVPGFVVAATAAYSTVLQHAKQWEKIQRERRLAESNKSGK